MSRKVCSAGTGRCTNDMCDLSPSIRHMISEGAWTVEDGTPPTSSDYRRLFDVPCTTCDMDDAWKFGLCRNCIHMRLYHLIACLKNTTTDGMPLLELGTLEELRQRETCTFCSMVAHMFKSTRSDRQRPETTVYMFPRVAHLATKYRRMILEPRTETPDLLFAMPTKESSNMFLQFEIERYAMVTAKEIQQETRERDLRTSDKGVNWRRIGEWVARSLADRSDRTIGETRSVPRAPPNFRLLDVNRGCITEAPGQAVYAALSYVWGQKLPDEVECTLENVAELSQPGQLSRTHLPETIQDALTFCKKFNIQYLWVDRLCIVQDDAAQKHDQISAMDAIYSLAVLTICAAAGDSSRAGLPGIGRSRQLMRLNAQVFDLEIRPVLPDLQVSVNEGTWPERGWTFQESLLGGYLFLFTEYQVFLSNLNDSDVGEIAEDDLTDSGETSGWFEGATSIKAMEEAYDNSMFEFYRGYVQQFTRRKLSYVSDTYVAFSGAYKFIYADLDTYIYGLPEKDFDVAMIWSCGLPPDLSPPTVPKDVVLPTWSWGSMADWATTIRSGGYDTVASVAKWLRCDAKGQVRPIKAMNDPTANRIAYRWILQAGAPNQAIDPRPYVLAAWSACIETPVPTVYRLRSSSDSILRKRWPTYTHYWDEAFRNYSRLQCNDTLQALREKPGRIAVRTTVKKLRVWAGAVKGASQEFFIIDEDGWCMGKYMMPIAITKAHEISGSSNSLLPAFDFLALSLRFERDADFHVSLNRRFSEAWLRQNVNKQSTRPPPPSKEKAPAVTVHGTDGHALEEEPVLTLMMVGWNEGIAHRINLASVSLARWIRTSPSHQNIILE